MKNIIDLVREKPWTAWLIFAATVVIVFLVGLFAASIIERRSEAQYAFQLLKPIPDNEPRNEVWGESFPREFESYRRTIDTTFRSKYAGSAPWDYLADDPRLVVLWSGYAFSREYRQARGHYHAVEDIRTTLRTGVPQPGACWTCKSTDVPRVMQKMGVAEFYREKWDHLGSEIVNNIGCQDCHDPKTLDLRITRPALVEAYKRMGKDISQATHQEMRSLVCAQCHVEYYFKGKDDKYLTFPWDRGMSVDSVETCYDAAQFTDWVHQLSRAPMLKAQHPDFEMVSTGIHAGRNISCAECHMPYRNEGGVKYTDHWIQSPLNNIAGSCQVCHRESESTLRANVEERQDKIRELLSAAEDALVGAHVEAKAAWDNGATETEMKPVLQLIRHAQWRWDYVAASNSLGFHSPVEAARIAGSSIQKAMEARRLLAKILMRHGIENVHMPDLSTKQKAQTYVGLNMNELVKAKQVFLQNVVPSWEKRQ